MRETNSLWCPRFRWFAIHKAKAQYQIIKVKYNEQLFNTLITTRSQVESGRGHLKKSTETHPNTYTRGQELVTATSPTPNAFWCWGTWHRAKRNSACRGSLYHISHALFVLRNKKLRMRCLRKGLQGGVQLDTSPTSLPPGLAKGRRQAQAPLEMRFY